MKKRQSLPNDSANSLMDKFPGHPRVFYGQTVLLGAAIRRALVQSE